MCSWICVPVILIFTLSCYEVSYFNFTRMYCLQQTALKFLYENLSVLQDMSYVLLCITFIFTSQIIIATLDLFT